MEVMDVVIAVAPLGYPAVEGRTSKKKSLQEVTAHNKL